MARKQKLHLVERLAWCPLFQVGYRRGTCRQHESAHGVPVGAFVTRAEASKYATELMAEARRELNPFLFVCDELCGIVEGGEDDLLAALAQLDLPEPTHEMRSSVGIRYIDWPRWYDDLADTLTDEERDAIWALLDRVELYRVVEVEFLV